MKKRIIVSLLILINFVVYLSAQDCTGYHQYHCVYADYTFFYSRQSKSALFQRGQTSELNIVAYGGEDYYIAVCAHRKFGDLHFKIMLDDENRTLLYDNSMDDFAKSVVFSNDVTRNLIVEVKVPEGSNSDRDRRCVGILVQFSKDENEE